ncbi:MAG TPA: PEP/pyruvate-binding domain-containing protein [Vicinamibacterales bacterium]|jgi:pyruvate,water dikinase|nr:PEP/pyruvate-binding domain-containing protein [Vicinamibacterales bacterium]
MDDRLVPLADAAEESAFGGKAVSLGAAIRAGLPVPPGVALGTVMVDRVADGDVAAIEVVLSSPHIPDQRLAVRSSAVGEDSADASFAGQHATKLNVRKPNVREAVQVVWASARTAAALAYRTRKGLPAHPKIAVVVQLLVEPVAAGVLFTRNPISGADERMIEASWGLGEAVVSGIVVPDRATLNPQGIVLDFVVGDKDVKIWYDEDDGTSETPVDEGLRSVPCVDESHLEALNDLANRCQRVWGPALDIEWALGGDGNIYLLQCRPITTLGSSTP